MEPVFFFFWPNFPTIVTKKKKRAVQLKQKFSLGKNGLKQCFWGGGTRGKFCQFAK